MSYWIEIRCSLMNAPGCYSSVGSNTPMQRTGNNTLRSVIHTLLILTEEARKLGWKERDKSWVCPKCHQLARQN